MFKSKGFPARAAPLLLGLGAAAIAAGAGQAGSESEPVRCEIRAETSGGMTTLEGVVRADKAVSGSYRFRVKSSGASGSSNIDQGGAFTAAPASPETLGSVMLGSRGARYDASLTVTVNGKKIECSDRVGGAI
ncbi:curli-like amyloid fiber formation chaperone CsgH [Mesorhizobium sp. WSM2239]|uniref:Curli-like amyloid fiber formation chaperone CsgH n=2 Tax=unclassified Mesorhizobium TaxID=325217 RepID=A0AAU8DIW5_9HYPH